MLIGEGSTYFFDEIPPLKTPALRSCGASGRRSHDSSSCIAWWAMWSSNTASPEHSTSALSTFKVPALRLSKCGVPRRCNRATTRPRSGNHSASPFAHAGSVSSLPSPCGVRGRTFQNRARMIPCGPATDSAVRGWTRLSSAARVPLSYTLTPPWRSWKAARWPIDKSRARTAVGSRVSRVPESSQLRSREPMRLPFCSKAT